MPAWATVIICLHFRYSCQNSKLSYYHHKHCRQHSAEILNHILFLSLHVPSVWVAGPAVMLIPTPTSLLFLGCVIRCVLVAAGERLALWNFNKGELVPSFPFAACSGHATECQWDIRVEAGWIGSGCGRRDLSGWRALYGVRSVHVGSQRRHSMRHSVSQGYLSAPQRQCVPSLVLLCQEADNLSAFCSALTLVPLSILYWPWERRVLD